MARRARMFGWQTSDLEPNLFPDVHSVVTDALVETGDNGQLNRHLKIDTPGRVRFENRLNELALQIVQK